MLIIYSLYLFLLGLIVGSFLNVVILRYNTGRGIGGRSGCMTCKRTLSWYELIPVASWIVQRGRCRGCHTKISIQYPIVELATGLLFLFNFLYIFTSVQSFTELLVYIPLTTLIWIFFVIVFVYDVRHKIIPDIFSFTLWGLSIAFAFVAIIPVFSTVIPAKAGIQLASLTSLLPFFSHIVAGFFFYTCVWALWKISKGAWIGLGDAKLLLSIGTILGFVYGLSAIFIAFWIGALYAITLMLKQKLNKGTKHITMKTEIPFGPFLIIGFAVVYFTGIDVTNLGIILEYYGM